MLDPAERRATILAQAEQAPAAAEGSTLRADEGLFAGGQRSGRMAGGDDRRVRRALSRRSGRGAPRLHARQPEVFLVLAIRHRGAGQQVPWSSPISSPATAERRSQRAMDASSGPACPTRSISGRPIRRLAGLRRQGKPLDQRLAKLRALNIVFHQKLGTQGQRVDRIVALAKEIAPLVGADPEQAARAAELAKADLVTEVVGEFPETQGLMGRYYAELQGERAEVAAAIEEHYKPQGPSDRIPTAPVSIAVALADKLDTLVGFWAIDEKPTGSKDPFALRRAALGVIRLVLENGLRLSSFELIISRFHSLAFDFAAEPLICRQKAQTLAQGRGRRHDPETN